MRSALRLLGMAAVLVASASCGDVVRTGRSPAYLILNSLAGSRGASTSQPFTAVLISDVLTNVTTPAPCSTTTPCPTTFGDPGQAVMTLALKDIGTATVPSAPTTNNAITITRYRVTYRRADGRNTPGVDVPYAFDGSITATILGSTATTVGFDLVRLTAKLESPLIQLRFNGSIITVLADVTFYGRDQVGNETSVAGTIQIDFADFGDVQ